MMTSTITAPIRRAVVSGRHRDGASCHTFWGPATRAALRDGDEVTEPGLGGQRDALRVVRMRTELQRRVPPPTIEPSTARIILGLPFRHGR